MGDSLTYGYGAEDPKTQSYPVYLSGLKGDYVFQAENYGFSGATAMTGERWSYTRTRAYRDSVDARADIYLCMLGSNDISQHGWREDFLSDYRELLKTYLDLENAPLVVLLLPPHIYLGGSYDDQMRELNAKLRALAEELDLPLIDLYGYSADMKSYSVEGLHFNAAGYERFASYIYEQLCEILPGLPS